MTSPDVVRQLASPSTFLVLLATTVAATTNAGGSCSVTFGVRAATRVHAQRSGSPAACFPRRPSSEASSGERLAHVRSTATAPRRCSLTLRPLQANARHESRGISLQLESQRARPCCLGYRGRFHESVKDSRSATSLTSKVPRSRERPEFQGLHPPGPRQWST